MIQWLKRDDNWKAVLPVAVSMTVVLLVVTPAFIFHRPHIHGHTNQLRPQTYLRNIAQGLVIYGSDNKDMYPDKDEWQHLLIQSGIVEEYLFTSPLEDGDGFSYALVALQVTFDQSEILVYEDPKHHEEGVLVAFGDCRVEFVDFEVFEQMLAEQLSSQTVEP